MACSSLLRQRRHARGGHTRGVSLTDEETDRSEGSEAPWPWTRGGTWHEDDPSNDFHFLARMECISYGKWWVGKEKYKVDSVGDFMARLKVLQELWNELKLDDLEDATRCGGRNLNVLFETLTLRFPPVHKEIKVPRSGDGVPALHPLLRHLKPDSVFFSSLRGKRRFFEFDTGMDTGDHIDHMEQLWRQNIERNWTSRSLFGDCTVEADVDVVAVGLMKELDADLLLMLVLAKYKPEEPHAISAHAFLYMSLKKQLPLYLIQLGAACVSIMALIEITYCTKVLGCSDGFPGEPCCNDTPVDHRGSPILVLSVGLWFLITDLIYLFILHRDTFYAKETFQSSKVFELVLEATTTVIAAKMVWQGWMFATKHFVQFFLVVACRWLHLLYILIPVPFFGRTVLPMYQAIFSYESKAFIAVNLVMLAGTFQGYISLRSDVNAKDYQETLGQLIGDALMAQYRLNFLGDFSTDEMMGESQKLKDDAIVAKQSGDAQQRQGIAVFIIFTTFIQAVLMLNLYIGILSEAYGHYKANVDTEFLQFRANFMLKNICLLRFLELVGLGRFKKWLEGCMGFRDPELLWAVSPHATESQKEDRKGDDPEKDEALTKFRGCLTLENVHDLMEHWSKSSSKSSDEG